MEDPNILTAEFTAKLVRYIELNRPISILLLSIHKHMTGDQLQNLHKATEKLLNDFSEIGVLGTDFDIQVVGTDIKVIFKSNKTS